jgi:hypothetical protein
MEFNLCGFDLKWMDFWIEEEEQDQWENESITEFNS